MIGSTLQVVRSSSTGCVFELVHAQAAHDETRPYVRLDVVRLCNTMTRTKARPLLGSGTSDEWSCGLGLGWFETHASRLSYEATCF